ncbi:MAG: hypothetical protein IJO34_04070 [Akkermansia sp.]|nr:hypothetical protein [Akkermansia sp.]
MKHAFVVLAALLSLNATSQGQSLLPTVGQDPLPVEEEKASRRHSVPQWVIELSNMSESDRAAYLQAFQAAKVAYANNRLAVCESHLNTCELYFTRNPNVWLLRSSVCIQRGQYDKAETYIRQAQQADIDSHVVLLNLSLLHMAQGEYEAALENTDELLQTLAANAEAFGTRRSLTYRKFLCLIMLERTEEAKELVADISPIDDSPLYYYCQAALFMLQGNPSAATRDLNTADAIFAHDGHLPGYKQNLSLCGLRERMRQKKSQGK